MKKINAPKMDKDSKAARRALAIAYSYLYGPPIAAKLGHQTPHPYYLTDEGPRMGDVWAGGSKLLGHVDQRSSQAYDASQTPSGEVGDGQER